MNVVKHRYKQPLFDTGTKIEFYKMDGREQSYYGCKLWSSLMVFDTWRFSEFGDELLDVNTDPGSYLHGFEWYPGGPDALGSIPESWNFIPGHSDRMETPGFTRNATLTPDAIHFTNGTPLHKGCENTLYGAVFLNAYKDALLDEARKIGCGV